MPRIVRLAALALLLCIPSGLRAEWREAASSHFLVYSEGSEDDVRAFATKLERFDQAMRIRLNLRQEDVGPANRVVVYVVDDVGDVRRLGRFGAKADVAGFYTPRAGGSVAVTPRRSDGRGPFGLDPGRILLHEYSHHIMFENAAMAFPAWFREGFAEFYSTALFEKDGSIRFGAAANHRAFGLIGMNPLPIEILFDPTQRKLSPVEWEATIYGRGWLLTHYLMFAASRKGQLATYLNALNGGKGSLEAARTAFGDLKLLDKELKAYLMQKRIPAQTLSGDALKIEPVRVRTLRPGESAIMRLRMRSHVGVRRDDAVQVAAEMRAAAKPYPNDPAVQAALAEAEFDVHQLDAAEAAADRAIAADPKNSNALLYKARVRLERAAASASDSAAPWKEARRHIAAANRADPDDPRPLILFYESFGRERAKPTRNAVEGLLHAFALAPSDRRLRLIAAHQYLLDGKAAEARAALAPLAYDPHGGAAAERVAAMIAKLDSEGTEAALKAGAELERPAAPPPPKKD
jgi:tetratricopeptide (TPR) repeat protein